ncbi:hypothetical protein ACP4OV_000735 [Aristida adscensionis]
MQRILFSLVSLVPSPLAVLAMEQALAATVGDHATAGATTTRKSRRVPILCTADYEEISCLGAGGFGDVVMARHRATGEAVAIKRLRSADGRNGELLREARFLDACCKSGHPFLVGYHGLARDRATGELCLVMEYVGPSLRDYLRGRRSRGSPPLPEATVRAVMWQLLAGAQSMHDVHRVVHRDIKPANILVGADHRVVKICDLGLAVSMAEQPPYARAGTLPYMAPEVRQGRQQDSDLLVVGDTWSLGCVMAELIAGRPLFEGSEEMGQFCAIFNVLDVPGNGRHSRLRKLFPAKKLSKEGFEALKGLLAYNPNKRLTAIAALKLPWFAKVTALKLPQEEDEATTAPLPAPEKKRLKIAPPPLLKRLLRHKVVGA